MAVPWRVHHLLLGEQPVIVYVDGLEESLHLLDTFIMFSLSIGPESDI
jgi:hypothetical protein